MTERQTTAYLHPSARAVESLNPMFYRRVGPFSTILTVNK